MLTTNNNDILFDDLALITLSGRSGQSTIIPVMYGDCNNRYETETAENLSTDRNCFGDTSIEDDEEFSHSEISGQNMSRYSDCTNN